MGKGKLSAGKLWMIAYRDLRRNRRRSLLTLIAVALGLALLVLTVGLVEGSDLRGDREQYPAPNRARAGPRGIL